MFKMIVGTLFGIVTVLLVLSGMLNVYYFTSLGSLDSQLNDISPGFDTYGDVPDGPLVFLGVERPQRLASYVSKDMRSTETSLKEASARAELNWNEYQKVLERSWGLEEEKKTFNARLDGLTEELELYRQAFASVEAEVEAAKYALGGIIFVDPFLDFLAGLL